MVLAAVRTAVLVTWLVAACGQSAAPSDGSTADGGADAGSRDGATSDGDALADATSMDAEPMDAGVDGAEDAAPPRCPGVSACRGVEGSPTEQAMESVDGCAFVLEGPHDRAAAEARADALVTRAGGAVSIDSVVGHLNRAGRAGISADSAYRMRNHDFVGFRWNAGDEDVDYWYPQGMTGSSDAREDGRVSGRRTVLVSWYHRTDALPTKGVRVSLADITDLENVRYRHLLLVTPVGDGATVDFEAATYGDGAAVHAGGIAWIGDKLYVAITSRGFRVYDMARIFRPTNTDDTGRIGFSGTRSDAHGYRYAVPEIARYSLAGDSCRVRFSFVGFDRDGTPPALVSGEYHADDVDGRVVRWPVDLASGWLAGSGGRVFAEDAVLAAQSRMQGAVTFEDVYYVSSSSQASGYGRLYRNRPGLTSQITAWPRGCEDLYVERAERLIWTSAEHPGTRDTLGIPMQGR